MSIAFSVPPPGTRSSLGPDTLLEGTDDVAER